MASKRIAKYHKHIQEDPVPGITANPRPNDLFFWDCTISGPPGTPWEEGNFLLTVSFPQSYPFKPPHVRFESCIFHPNFYPDGSICVDILAERHTPALSLMKILLSIQSMLDDPILESPANPEAAKLYTTNRRLYNKKVRAMCAATHIKLTEDHPMGMLAGNKKRRTEDRLYSENDGLNNSDQAGPSVAGDGLEFASSVVTRNDIASASLTITGDEPASISSTVQK